MAKRNSVLEDLFEIASKIPWWAGLGLALGVFVVLHGVAGQTVTPVTGTAQLGDAAVKTLWVTLASYGQWILPIPLLIGAGASALNQRKRAALHAAVSDAQDRGAAIRQLSWQEFEQLVGEAFRQRGFSVAETGGAGADGGIDLVMSKGRERHLVQCKQWKALQVGVNVVRELYGVMSAQGATGGFVVTSGRFSADAEEFARGCNIELVDGQKLELMFAQARPGMAARETSRDAIAAARSNQAGADAEVPSCPRCGLPMARRVARQGAQAGNAFWGCSGYPKCRGTRSID